jgi:hypothetical protein
MRSHSALRPIPETLAHITAGIAELWIQFAHLNKKAKRFKAVFMTAVSQSAGCSSDERKAAAVSIQIFR